MTHHNISYKSIADRKERDRRAIQDTIEYLGQDRWELLLELIKTDSISTINTTMGFIGVSGYPFFAICRGLSASRLPGLDGILRRRKPRPDRRRGLHPPQLILHRSDDSVNRQNVASGSSWMALERSMVSPYPGHSKRALQPHLDRSDYFQSDRTFRLTGIWNRGSVDHQPRSDLP